MESNIKPTDWNAMAIIGVLTILLIVLIIVLLNIKDKTKPRERPGPGRDDFGSINTNEPPPPYTQVHEPIPVTIKHYDPPSIPDPPHIFKPAWQPHHEYPQTLPIPAHMPAQVPNETGIEVTKEFERIKRE